MKMKRTFCLLILSLGAFLGHVRAYDFMVNGIYYNITSSTDYTVEVTKDADNPYTAASIVVPSSVTYSGNTYTVTAIGNIAFRNVSFLTSVSLPATLISVGASAFAGCTSLDSVILPEGLLSLGNYAFSGCSGLTFVYLPSELTTMGSYVFQGCSNLATVVYNARECDMPYQDYQMPFVNKQSITTLILGDSVRFVPDYLAKGCANLDSIYFGTSIRSIGGGSFEGCSSLENVILTLSQAPTGVAFGGGSFKNCTALRRVVFPANTTIIGQSSFEGDTSLSSIYIPNSVASIGASAFYDCSNLVSVHLPDSLNDLSASCFGNCGKLASIQLPSTLKSIGAEAFDGCESLARIRIPDSVTTIGNYAFYMCTRLDSLCIGPNVYSVGYGVFVGCDSLKHIHWNAAVISVFEYNQLFDNGARLSSVVFGDTARVLPKKFFQGVSSVDTVVFGKSISTVDGEFWQSGMAVGRLIFNSRRISTYNVGTPYKLQSVEFGECVQAIPASMFRNCKRLKSVNLSDSVSTIGDFAFYSCDSLTTVRFPDAMLSIGTSAFERTAIDTLTLPSSITSIGRFAFRSCNSLRVIFYNSSLLTTHNNTLNGLLNLREVHIGESVQTIPAACFTSNGNLRKIIIGERVNNIGDSAFSQCVLVDTIVSNATAPPTIYANTFADINQFVPVIIPCGASDWYSVANYWTNFHNIVEVACVYHVEVAANDDAMGFATGSGNYTSGTQVTLTATAFDGFHFVRWADEDTTNPRVVTITQDTSFWAVFVADSTEHIAQGFCADIAIYPNPTTGLVTIDAESLQKVEVVDKIGRIRKISASRQLDLSGLPSGNYLLRISTAQGLVISRLSLIH